MSKAIITLTDLPEEESVQVSIKFDPPITKDDPDEPVPMSASLALDVAEFLVILGARQT